MSFLDSVFSNQTKVAQTAFLASAVIAVGYAAYSFFGTSSSSLAPAITEEQARKMMNKVLEQVKLAVPRFLRAADNIKQQIVAQGQEIEDAQILKSFILPHLESTIRDITQSVLDELDYDEDELEEAVKTYVAAGDEELITITQTLKTIYKQFGGEGGDDSEETGAGSSKASEMTLPEVLTLLEELAQLMVDNCDTFCQQFVATFGIPSTRELLEKFQVGLFQATESSEKELLKAHGMTTTDFQAVLTKYQNEKRIQEIFYIMQMENQRVLQSHGIQMS